MHAEDWQAVGVATNTPLSVGRCDFAEEEEEISSAGSMLGWEKAQQKRRVREAFELLNQHVIDAMTDLAHASSLISRRIRH